MNKYVDSIKRLKDDDWFVDYSIKRDDFFARQRIISNVCRKFNLFDVHWNVMNLIHRGVTNCRDISLTLDVQSTYVSSVLARLDAAILVDRNSPSAEDKRLKHLSLTKTGLSTLKKINSLIEDKLKQENLL